MNIRWIHTLFAVFLVTTAIASSAADESSIRSKLKIPPNAQRVLILSQSSHLDWDWLDTFPGYYNSRVETIFTLATSLLQAHHNDSHPYYYSIAETGFLQRFWETNPAGLSVLRSVGDRLHIVGGGISTPDSLLSNGEAFIRNYLVGQQALRSVNLPNITNLWVPDDFGHDGQLPVMVRAMGLKGAGFARVPGAGDQAPAARRLDGLPSIAQELMNDGVSFKWVANDGSEIFAHWLQDHYNQGDGIDDGTTGNPSDCATYTSSYNSEITNKNIQKYIDANGPTAVSPYMFVPIGDDFTIPKSCLLTYCQNWNTQVFGNPSSSYSSDLYVLSATFDDYVELVQSFADDPRNNKPLKTRNFEPTPYWTGFYASRPALKILQEKSTRALIASESLSFITQNRSVIPMIAEQWAKVAPSTHHDFITGTSIDYVYQSEQLPYLLEASASSESLAKQLLQDLANQLVSNAKIQEAGIVMYNSLGFQRDGPVEIPSMYAPNAVSFFDGKFYHPIQKTQQGTFLSWSTSNPSFGYHLGKLSTTAPSPRVAPVKIENVDSGNTYIMSNAYVRVTISKAANWAATSIFDISSGTELVQTSATDLGAFGLEIMDDSGNIYRFGHEMPNCGFRPATIIQTPLSVEFIEEGPVRGSITTVLQVRLLGSLYNFTRTYSLYAEEKMVRVNVTGAAPSYTSVFMRTPLVLSSPQITYGTPYHWDNYIPPAYWTGYTFFVAHNFVTLTNKDGSNLAFYSSSLRSWTLDGNTMVTTLFRNTPGGQCIGYGADGSDSGTHSHELAFRLSGSLSPSPSMIPLTESLSFSTPVMTSYVHINATFASPSWTMASVDDPETAIIMAVKPSENHFSQLVFRVYSATASQKNPVQFTISTQISSNSVMPITALENPLPEGETSVVAQMGSPNLVKVTQSAALVSLKLSPIVVK